MAETGSSMIDPSMAGSWDSEENDEDRRYEHCDRNTEKRMTLIWATEGFYAGHWKFHQIIHATDDIVEFPNDEIVVILAARIAISVLNVQQGSNLDFMEVVRVNSSLMVCYLTIRASDNQFYEAKVYLNPLSKEFKVMFVRPAVHYPKVNRAFRKYDAPDASDEDYAPAAAAKAKAKAKAKIKAKAKAKSKAKAKAKAYAPAAKAVAKK